MKFKNNVELKYKKVMEDFFQEIAAANAQSNLSDEFEFGFEGNADKIKVNFAGFLKAIEFEKARLENFNTVRGQVSLFGQMVNFKITSAKQVMTLLKFFRNSSLDYGWVLTVFDECFDFSQLKEKLLWEKMSLDDKNLFINPYKAQWLKNGEQHSLWITLGGVSFATWQGKNQNSYELCQCIEKISPLFRKLIKLTN